MTGHSPGLAMQTQDVASMSTGHWSEGKQLFVKAKQIGDYVELQIPADAPEARKIALFLTRSYDYGILHITVISLQEIAPPASAQPPKTVADDADTIQSRLEVTGSALRLIRTLKLATPETPAVPTVPEIPPADVPDLVTPIVEPPDDGGILEEVIEVLLEILGL